LADEERKLRQAEALGFVQKDVKNYLFELLDASLLALLVEKEVFREQKECFTVLQNFVINCFLNQLTKFTQAKFRQTFPALVFDQNS